MDESHLPDPPPPRPPAAGARHPMLATGGILGVVIAICILLAIVAMLS
ncbi:MAG TPA: hypothetical protein VFU21_02015 [Kofleriaceae bacterium]|nr:hypothetical protein [Kofleriaceae bacterium]